MHVLRRPELPRRGAAQFGTSTPTPFGPPCTARCCRNRRLPPPGRITPLQAVVLFPTARAATDFEASHPELGGLTEPPAHLPQPIGPEQVWSVGQISTDHDVSRCRGRSRAPSGGLPAGPDRARQRRRRCRGQRRRAPPRRRPRSPARSPTGCPPLAPFGTRLTNPIALGAPFGARSEWRNGRRASLGC